MKQQKYQKKKEQVDFHFPKSEVTVVENDPDFTIAAEGAAEGSIVTYSISADGERSATVDNNGTVHLKQEGGGVITAVASETDEYKSKEISYKLHILGAPMTDIAEVIDKVGDDISNPGPVLDTEWKDIEEWKVPEKENIPEKEYIRKKIEKEGMIQYNYVDQLKVEESSKIINDIMELKEAQYIPEKWSAKTVYEYQGGEYGSENKPQIIKPEPAPELEVKNYDTVTVKAELIGLGISSPDDIKKNMVYVMHEIIQDKTEFVTAPIIYDVSLKNETAYYVDVSFKSLKPIAITIPYPKGTDRHKHDFIVCHMFEHEMNGKKPGDMEFPKVTKGEEGFSFTLTGFSPVAIACVEAKSVDPNNGENEEKKPNDETIINKDQSSEKTTKWTVSPNGIDSSNYVLDIQNVTDEIKQQMQNTTKDCANKKYKKDLMGSPIVYDVNLKLKNEDGIEKEISPDNFPAEGVTITVPYPEGTNKDKHNFIVCHMFEHGEKAGQIEYPKVTKNEDGISFTVTGLSPISIGWVEAKTEPVKGTSTSNKGKESSDTTQNDSNTNTNKNETEDQVNANNTGSANQVATNTPAASSSRSPKTADNNSIILYLILMFVSIGGLIRAMKYRYCK